MNDLKTGTHKSSLDGLRKRGKENPKITGHTSGKLLQSTQRFRTINFLYQNREKKSNLLLPSTSRSTGRRR